MYLLLQSILGVAKPSVASLLNRPPLGTPGITGGVSAATTAAVASSIASAASSGNSAVRNFISFKLNLELA